jgi:hypothetical protein
MTDQLISQIVIQMPTVGILLYLLFRLDQRIAELIKVICELADRNDDQLARERLAQLSPRSRGG